ncbi:uncharacterized protein LOC135465826 [Liolophura sinensis]|uniref:uncharacterized protein LOC135465826 n=1 Tax=Liolophura sinensis TaxID=3198878 RepID=UPI003158079C
MKIILVQLLWYILFLSGHAGATPAVSGVEIGELRNGNTKYNSRMEHNTFWLYEGEELNLICLVKNGSFLAQNNTFVFKHEQGVVKELVTDGQAEQFLVIKKVTEKHAGLYSCRLHPGDSLVGRLTVRVSPKPLNCIVYNWDRLTCRWNVTNPPDTRLVWTIVGPFYYECPHHAPNFCEWRVDDNNHLDSFKPYMSYYKMCLVSTNDTRCYYKERVYLNTIVKPDPVPLKDLRLSSPSSRTLEIRGNNTSKHKVNLLYRFHLKGGSVNQTWNSTSLYYHFTGLTPYTRYTLAVTCVPKEQSQYTSEAVHLNLTTLADVPDGPPGVTSGGFWQGLCRDNNTRDVIVYLQPIDDALRNAPRIRYNVCASDTEFVFAKEPTWGDNSIQLHLNCDAEYKLKLCGESEVGGSNHGANLTIPPSISKGTYRNFDLIVEEDTDLNVVIMTWPEFARDVQRLSPDVQHFTVYYCKRGHLDMPICKDNIEWIHLPPSNNYTFNLTEDFLRVTGDIMVGLSTDSQNTTGILWSPCVFMKRADLQKPRGLQVTENEDQNLVVKWNPTECEDRTGVVQHPFVRRYRVVYCEIDSNMYSTQERHPCPASERMKIVSKDTSVELRNVRPGYHYAVAVQAVVEDRDGPWTEWKETQISRTITTGEIAGIVIGSIVVLCFSPYGLLVLVR